MANSTCMQEPGVSLSQVYSASSDIGNVEKLLPKENIFRFVSQLDARNTVSSWNWGVRQMGFSQ